VKVLSFDSIGGASGDMILAALVDLGVDAHALERELSSLGIGPFRLEHSRAMTSHLAGTRLRVVAGDEPHTHHGHHHHASHHEDHAPHRGLAEIEALIQAATLPDPVKTRACQVFRRIGEVEARMHGTTVDRIHFHEIGAVDSIVDIVGSCLALHRLGVDAVAVGPLPQGHGVITCAHGTFPNPAPATVELLTGMAIVQTDEPYELVTPTGAALLSSWKSLDRVPDGAVVGRIGYGVGHRSLHGRPNLLRAVLLETRAASSEDHCLVLETNLDDVTPELVGALTTRLLEAGALDVFTVAAQMKKQRPGMLLSVLCAHAQRETLLDLLFRESTTFGVREYDVRRTVLARRSIRVSTRYGDVAVKLGEWKGAVVTRAPEFEECAARAREHQVPVRAVYEAALAAAQQVA
jgi:uncharacterized protein (TIGR00299 family) protein